MEPTEDKSDKEAHTRRHSAEFLDESAEIFHQRMSELMSEGREIFVFRGAGTNNGIAAEDMPQVIDKIAALLDDALESGRKIVIMFDGDDDNREKPDIGNVFGMVADIFRNNPSVLPIAAQKKGWYYPKADGAALESATGTPYETYVLPDNAPLRNGADYPMLTPQTDLTQSEALAQYPRYQQIFVGPAGPIAFAQLGDLNEKAGGNKVNVLAISTHNNPELAPEFEARRQMYTDAGDTEKEKEIQKVIEQRKNSLGALYSPDGTRVELGGYENLAVTIDDSILFGSRAF